jgi:hypothetical protein
MFNYHPAIKIVIVFLLCCQMTYYNYLMFNAIDFAQAVKESAILNVGIVFYFLVALFFADYYWRQKLFFIFAFWIILNAAFCTNGIIFVLGSTPPLYIQYAQSTSLVIFSTLLIFTKYKFPNWLRIFSLLNLLALIPCLYFYFAENWYWYRILVYVVCFTPVLKSLVFIDERIIRKADVIDN